MLSYLDIEGIYILLTCIRNKGIGKLAIDKMNVNPPPQNPEKYIEPTAIIDCNHPSILEKAEYLTRNQRDDIKKAISLFYFVRDEIRYNIYVPKSLPKHFQASNILARETGYCVQKAVLLVALSRAAGIPAGLGFARIKNNLLPEKTFKQLGTNVFPFHGYAELYLGGNWIKATTAFDLETCQKNRIVPVEFDGENDAIFHLYNQDGKVHMEYLADLGRGFHDLPLDTLKELVAKYIGNWFLEPSNNI